MVQKLLTLQYADTKAHHPDKIKKRIDYLDYIPKRLGYIWKKDKIKVVESVEKSKLLSTMLAVQYMLVIIVSFTLYNFYLRIENSVN